MEENIILSKGHTYNEIITEPTETEQGFTTYTCNVCGKSYISDYVDPVTVVDFSCVVTSFLSDTDEITVELVRRGESEVAYSLVTAGKNAEITFENILSRRERKKKPDKAAFSGIVGHEKVSVDDMVEKICKRL